MLLDPTLAVLLGPLAAIDRRLVMSPVGIDRVQALVAEALPEPKGDLVDLVAAEFELARQVLSVALVEPGLVVTVPLDGDPRRCEGGEAVELLVK